MISVSTYSLVRFYLTPASREFRLITWKLCLATRKTKKWHPSRRGPGEQVSISSAINHQIETVSPNLFKEEDIWEADY